MAAWVLFTHYPALSHNMVRGILEMCGAFEGQYHPRQSHYMAAIDELGTTFAELDIGALSKGNVPPTYVLIRPCSEPSSLFARIELGCQPICVALATHAPWVACWYCQTDARITVINWETGQRVQDFASGHSGWQTFTLATLMFRPGKLILATDVGNWIQTWDVWSWPTWSRKIHTKWDAAYAWTHGYPSRASPFQSGDVHTVDPLCPSSEARIRSNSSRSILTIATGGASIDRTMCAGYPLAVAVRTDQNRVLVLMDETFGSKLYECDLTGRVVRILTIAGFQDTQADMVISQSGRYVRIIETGHIGEPNTPGRLMCIKLK